MSQINFPNSPEDGDEFLAPNGTTYQYDSSTGQWKILAGPGVQGPPGSSASIPTGMVMPFVGSTAPTDWLECDGSSIPSQYTDLIALVGANVPDFRGEFIRGWDNGRGVDTGRSLGSTQDDAFQGHRHTSLTVIAQTANAGAVAAGPSLQFRNDSVRDPKTDGTNGTPRTSSETRPRNVALMYCIKT